MRKTLQKFAMLGAALSSVSCGALQQNTLEKNVKEPTPAVSKAISGNTSELRGTKGFEKTDEYKLLRTKLLNTWMPMCEMTEGFFPYIYRCSGGQPTVGIGTNMTGCNIKLKDMPLYDKKGNRLSVKQIESWINQTAGKGQSSCKKLAARLGYRGMLHADAEKLAHEEAALKVDLVHESMLKKHGMELFDQPLPIQVLILDLAYQRGHEGVFYNKSLWTCLKKKDYANTDKYTRCCPNKKRNTIKSALVHLTHRCKLKQDMSEPLAVLAKYNIKFHPSDLDSEAFSTANIDYKGKYNAAKNNKKTNKMPPLYKPNGRG